MRRASCPTVYLDAIHMKMRTSGHVQTQTVYQALALTLDGAKELLGMWARPKGRGSASA